MFGGAATISTPYSNAYSQQNSPPGVQQMPIPQPYGVTSPIAPIPPSTPSTKGSSTELDMNDPSTLEIYSRILLFKDDHMRDELAFSRTLSPKQRRVVHLVAQKLGVYHYSVGEGEERYAVVTRIDPNPVSRLYGGLNLALIATVRDRDSDLARRSRTRPRPSTSARRRPG